MEGFVNDQNNIYIILKIHEFFLFLFNNVHKEKMFTIEIELGAKRPESLVHTNP